MSNDCLIHTVATMFIRVWHIQRHPGAAPQRFTCNDHIALTAFLSTFITSNALKFIIRTSELENDCVLDGTLVIIANVYSICWKLIQVV